MDQTRRTAVAGLGASLLAGGIHHPAAAQALPRSVQRHPAFRPWRVMMDPDPAPLSEPVTLVDGRTVPLSQYIGKGPTILVLWAHWCAPCRSEKPAQAGLQRRLTYMRSSTRIKCVQAYDPTPLARARATLDAANCRELETARATPALEQAFVKFFGPSPNDGRRTALPSLVLLEAQGREIARATGALQSLSGHSYWGDAVTQQFMGTLDRLLGEA
jgi:thiol-disulfide isomerase/thioredoxin